MADATLPAEIRRFIARHLVTAAQADVLVLVQKERRRWTGADVGRELRIDTDQAESLLARLHRSGLLTSEATGYAFAPRTPRLAALTEEFCALYPVYRVAIISLIFSRPAGSIRDFSDAIAAGSLVIALYFLRFWRRSDDRLFAFFSAAFGLMALNGVALGLTDPGDEIRVYLYTLRLAAFVLIILAILDKNRSRPA